MRDKLSFSEMKPEVEEITRQELGYYKCIYFREYEFPCKVGPRA